MLLTIDERGSKIARNNVFDCDLSPIGKQMAIKDSVSSDILSTFVDNTNVFDLPTIRCEFTHIHLL